LLLQQYSKSEEFVGDDLSFSVIVYPDVYEVEKIKK
jgi:hypothetical protein